MGNTFGYTTVLIPGATVVPLYAIKTMSFVFHDRHNNQYDIIQKWAKFMTSKPMYVNFARLSNDRSLRHVLPPDTYYNATETIHAYTRTDQYTDQCVLVLSADQLRVFDELVAYVRGEDPASPLVPGPKADDVVPSSAVEEEGSPSATSDVSSAILEHRDAATAAATGDLVDFPLRTVAPDPNAVVTPWGGGDVAA